MTPGGDKFMILSDILTVGHTDNKKMNQMAKAYTMKSFDKTVEASN